MKDYINSFLGQPIVTEVRRNIQRKIDPSLCKTVIINYNRIMITFIIEGELWNVTANQIDDMYNICALETAIYGNSM